MRGASQERPTAVPGQARRSRARPTGRHEASRTRGDARRAEAQARRGLTSRSVERLAKAGLIARGVIYLVLAYLAFDIAAFGALGKQANSKGALQEVARQPAGPAVLALLAFGFAAYAAWRLLGAAGGFGTTGAQQAARRAQWAGIGFVYLLLCARASLVLASGRGGGGGTASVSAGVLSLPGGRFVLAVVGLAVLAGGAGLVVVGASQSFRHRLRVSEMSRGSLLATRLCGAVGEVTRGAVFAAVGGFLIAAAVTASARNAKGFGQTLRALAAQPYGGWLLGIVAVGLALFGVFSALEARYRRLDQG